MSTYESRPNESTNHIFGTLVGINIPSMIIYLLSNATNLNVIYLRVADNERLRNHSFTLEFEFAGFASEDPNRAIFRYSEKRLGLDDAHTYDYFGPQTFGCTEEQNNGGSFQGYFAEEPWAYPVPKHVEFEDSLDHVIADIDTAGGAFLVKVRENGMFADNSHGYAAEESWTYPEPQ